VGRSREICVGPSRSGATRPPTENEDHEVDDCRCGSHASWCSRADVLFNTRWGARGRAASRDHKLVIAMETEAETTGCPRCSVVAVGPRSTPGERGGCAVLWHAGADHPAQADVALP
jgi:hypothetical protein